MRWCASSKRLATRAEAVESGLTPKFPNPAEAVGFSLAQQDRYLATADALRKAEGEGVFKRYDSDTAPPARTPLDTDAPLGVIFDPSRGHPARRCPKG